MATTTRTQNIYTLVRPTWLDAAGMGKGINHDRQHLGLILDANQTINVRQTNPDFSTPLVARLCYKREVFWNHQGIRTRCGAIHRYKVCR